MNFAELESGALVGDIQLINKVNDLSSLQERLVLQIEQDKLISIIRQFNHSYGLVDLVS